MSNSTTAAKIREARAAKAEARRGEMIDRCEDRQADIASMLDILGQFTGGMVEMARTTGTHLDGDLAHIRARLIELCEFASGLDTAAILDALHDARA